MKAIFATILLFIITVVSADFVASINASQNLWVASDASPIARLPRDQFVALLGGLATNERLPEEVMSLQAYAAPTTFDARTTWPNKLVGVRNQGTCGSCWAFAVTTVAADRAMIHGKVPTGTVFSPQHMVNCDTHNLGCNGGNATRAWSFAANKGLRTESCTPYTSGNTGRSSSCTSRCNDSSVPTLYKSPGAVSTGSESIIMTQMATHGPVEMCMEVYADFQKYSSGIYKRASNDFLGGHAMVGVGYGVEDGTKYWIIQNSWGPNWGENGYLRIVRGINNCSIETRCSSYPVY